MDSSITNKQRTLHTRRITLNSSLIVTMMSMKLKMLMVTIAVMAATSRTKTVASFDISIPMKKMKSSYNTMNININMDNMNNINNSPLPTTTTTRSLSRRSKGSLFMTSTVDQEHENDIDSDHSSDIGTVQNFENLFWPSPPPGENESIQDNADNDADDTDTDTDDDINDEQAEQEAVFRNILDSIIMIHCTHREPDYLMPWQNVHQSTSTSSGFVIEMPDLIPTTTTSSSSSSATVPSPSSQTKERRLRIMTNAHSVEYGSIVQVQKRGDATKYLATVETIGQECDLAILNVQDKSFWEGLEHGGLEFGPLPELQDEVEVLGYPTGGTSLSITSGVVSRIEMQQYAQAGLHLLAMQIDAAINPGNSGGPVIDLEGKVVGVAFQSLTSAENIGYVVPVSIVQHFLQNIQRNAATATAATDDNDTNLDFPGFCSLGMRMSFLENPSYRKFVGMKPNQSGIKINSLAPTSKAQDIIRPNDIVLSIDGIPVANDGKIRFRPGERVSLVAYLQTKFEGDLVELEILRNEEKETKQQNDDADHNDGDYGGDNSKEKATLLMGQSPIQTKIKAPVALLKDLVPSHFNSRPPPYMIVGGLVFTILSCPYLDQAKAFDNFISDDMSYLVSMVNDPMPSRKSKQSNDNTDNTDNIDEDEEENSEIVILCQVLAHSINLGYDQYEDLHLKKCNGHEIYSLKQLHRLLVSFHEEANAAAASGSNDDNDESSTFVEFEFAPGGKRVVLEQSKIAQATEDVCEEHSIRNWYHILD